jgi:crossover junction endodeoxyribonuclease RuvC
MQKTLGIDQSYTSCAVVVSDDAGVSYFGRIVSEKDKSAFDRAFDISNEICKITIEHNVEKVCIEGLAFAMRGDATRDLAGLLFTIVTMLKVRCKDVAVVVVPPTTLKKFATGSGKADKTDMINALPEAVKDSFVSSGYKKTTGLTDLTDAYWLSIYHT